MLRQFAIPWHLLLLFAVAFISSDAGSETTVIGLPELHALAEQSNWKALQKLGSQYAEHMRSLALANSSQAQTQSLNADALHIFGVAEYQVSNVNRANLFLQLAINATGGTQNASTSLLHDAGLISLALRKRVGEVYLRASIEKDPYHLPTILTLGSHLVGQGLVEEAVEIYEQAGGASSNHSLNSHVRGSLSFCLNFAIALSHTGQLEEMAMVLQNSPDKRAELMAATAVMPIIPRSEGQIAFWRQHSFNTLQRFKQQYRSSCFEYQNSWTCSDTGRCNFLPTELEPATVYTPVPSASLLAANLGYYLPYHALNNRELMTEYGRLFRCFAFVNSASQQSPNHLSVYRDLTPRPSATKADVPTLIFVSGHLRNHTLGYLMHNLVESLPDLEYRVHVVTCSKVMDDISTQISDSITKSQIPGSYIIAPCGDNDGNRFQEVLAMISNLRPDVIVYNDIAMEGSSYLLAQYRLSRIQVLTMNNGLTSGLPNIDYYVSSDLTEPPDGQLYYTEQLVRLKGCMYATVDRPEVERQPENASELASWYDELGFVAELRQAGSHIYLIPQTLFKMHPRFDEVIQQILQRDPFGYVVLPKGAQPILAKALLARFQLTIRDENLLKRIHFVPPDGSFLSRPSFLRLLRLSTVVLDPAPFGGGLTSLEAFSVGKPVVTLNNSQRSGRLTLAMYGLMDMVGKQWGQFQNISCCVAQNFDEYVNMALALARPTSYERYVADEVVDAIRSRSDILFNDRNTIAQWDSFLRWSLSQSSKEE